MRQKRFKFLLFLVVFLFAINASADDPEMSCDGIAEKWFLSIDNILSAFEYKINEKIDQYVSVADFNVGNEDFGAVGTGDLGYIKVPKFDNKTPNQYLKSAIHDMGLSPSYTIDAKILGSQFEVVRVQISGGQGCQTKNNPAGCANGGEVDGQSGKDRINFDIKVAGMSVISDENDPPATEAIPLDEQLTPAQMSARLPTHQKKGAGGELFNIRRGFNGNQPIARIPIFDVVNITIDAGYVLHAGLIFSYEVKGFGQRIGGSTSYTYNLKSIAPQPQPPGGVPNPALDSGEYQDCGFNNQGSCISKPSIPRFQKTQDFWNSMSDAQGQNANNPYQNVVNSLRDLRIKETYKDAKLTKLVFQEKFDQLMNDPNMSPEQKSQLMQEMDLGRVKRDLKQLDRLYQNLNYESQVLVSVYNAIEESVQSISQGKIPQVTASAGVAIDGQAYVWANACIEFNAFSLIQAWSGIEGTLKLVDIAAGTGASVNSQSQYLDVTGKLDYEVLHGAISIRWGYSLMGGLYGDTGLIDLVNFTGVRRTNNSLIARIDFDPPSGKDVFFWCADLFGTSASIDTERCNDSSAALRKLTPGLAAHDDYQKFVLNETPIGKQNKCSIVSDGKFIYTSDDDASTCDNYLPLAGGSLDGSTTATGEKQHPLSLAFDNDPKLFLTFLRDNSNKPTMRLSALKETGSQTTRTYTASQAIQFDANTSTGQITPIVYRPVSEGMDTSSIEDRLFTVSTHGIMYDRLANPSDPTDPTMQTLLAEGTPGSAAITDSKFLINIEGVPNGSGTFPPNTKIFAGHLAALPNPSIVYLAEHFNLGQCRISVQGGNRKMLLNERPYPSEGVPDGDTLKNAKIPRLGCDLGTDSPSSTEVQMWEACMLRSAVVSGKCFPPNRVTDLIEEANLTDEQILYYFQEPHKRISGNIDFGPAKTVQYTRYSGATYQALPSNGATMGLPVTNFSQPPVTSAGTERLWMLNKTISGTLANRVSPSGTCEAFSGNASGYSSFPEDLGSPYSSLVGQQLVSASETGGPINVNTATGLPHIVINEDNCLDPWFDTSPYMGGGVIPGGFSIDHYLTWDSTLISPSRPHEVVMMCVEDNPTQPWAVPTRTWKGYIRSAKITRPYAVISPTSGNAYTLDEFFYDPTDPATDDIAEVYQELPPSGGNGGYVLGGSICDPSNAKNITNYPYGAGYGGNKLSQMRTGSIYGPQTVRAIRLCMAAGDCQYVSLHQYSSVAPVCSIKANVNTTNTVTTKNANTAGRNLDECLNSNLEFSSAENFCRNFAADIMGSNGANLNSSGYTRVQLRAKWEQLVDVGNALEHTVSDPMQGDRLIGECLFEKNGTTAKFVSGATHGTVPAETGDCELQAVGSTGNTFTLDTSQINNYNNSFTAQTCKTRFGFLSGQSGRVVANNDLQTQNTCTALSGTQILKLIENNIISYSGGTFNIQTRVTIPGNAYDGQTVQMGSCTIDANTINQQINDQTKCTLRMSTLNDYHAAPINIYLPPAVAGTKRLEQCRDAILRWLPSYGVFGSTDNICSAEMRKLPSYATLYNLAPAGSLIKYDMYLGETKATTELCNGAPITETQPLNSSDYNPDCLADIAASTSAGTSTPINLTPAQRAQAIDPNHYLSSYDPGSMLPVPKCQRYWASQMTTFMPNGTLSNTSFCQSIKEDVKARLSNINASIPAPNTTYTSQNVSIPSWTTRPLTGTVTTVNAGAKVYAMYPVGGGGTGIGGQISMLNPFRLFNVPLPGSFPTPSDFYSASNIRPAVLKSTDNSNYQLATLIIGGGGGGGPTVGGPDWMTSPTITQCSYEFKQLSSGQWDLMSSTWQETGRPPSSLFSNPQLREKRCVRDIKNKCMQTTPGDLLIFAGSGGRALKRYTAAQAPAINNTMITQFCDANYDSIIPLPDSLVSDPNKRFPVWPVLVDGDGNVAIPDVTTSTPYYCRPKMCEMYVEFGSEYFKPTESEWKDKLSSMPTNATACQNYYQSQVAEYCAKTLLLPQMPDNMDIHLKAVFDGQPTEVGICPATSTRRDCNIGQREPNTWFSWIMGDTFKTIETVQNYSKVLNIPSRRRHADMYIPNYFPNTLEACVEAAQELNYNNNLCDVYVDGINHNSNFEISVEFGAFSQKIATCSSIDPEPVTPAVERHALSADPATDNCNTSLKLHDYVPGTTIQIATCPEKDCDSKTLRVAMGTKPNDPESSDTLLNFNPIMQTTWSSTYRGVGSVYINQVDSKGNFGTWTKVDQETYIKFHDYLVNDCKINIPDTTAHLVGNVCEKTYIQIGGYQKDSALEVGTCTDKETDCNQENISGGIYPKPLSESEPNYQIAQALDPLANTNGGASFEFLPIVQATLPGTSTKGTIAIRQLFADGQSGQWVVIPKADYQAAALHAVKECGVSP